MSWALVWERTDSRNTAILHCVNEIECGPKKEEHPDGFVIAFLGSQFSGKTTNDW